MSRLRLLLAIDIFQDRHVQAVADCVQDWADWERVPEQLPLPEMEAKLAGIDIVVGWAPAVLLARSKVRWYLCGSAGVDAYRGHGLAQKPGGFTICNAAGTMSIPIAEHAIAMMFSLVRRLPDHERKRQARMFLRTYEGGEVTGSTACICGLGGSGIELARRCAALGMKVIGVRRDAAHAHPVVNERYSLAELTQAVAQADHVFCTLPATDETKGIFNAAVFRAMKPGAFFYNVSRGALVDTAALTDALLSGHLGGAGLDVCDPEPPPLEHPLWHLPNVLFTGHSAGCSPQLSTRLCELFVRNLKNLRAERSLENIVSV
ncbi:D-2-hydroxyacid dehydrogenase [Opitutaceae bacterium TAV4]|nr:D-2-hydroxyacid dehydrogenase [Opitutaceae bacterium TAV4]RRK02148.1 D-2-hydroxyacid dehydrogenase [Opitutaceae bacterium TAV3]